MEGHANENKGIAKTIEEMETKIELMMEREKKTKRRKVEMEVNRREGEGKERNIEGNKGVSKWRRGVEQM